LERPASITRVGVENEVANLVKYLRPQHCVCDLTVVSDSFAWSVCIGHAEARKYAPTHSRSKRCVAFAKLNGQRFIVLVP
jgi:hypothetical protein